MILPNLVLFPGTQIPLLIFEPRYRTMVEDVFKADRRFAVFLTNRRLHPDAFAVGCLGEIIAYEKLPNNFYQLVLRGQQRIFRLGWEPPRPYPYLSYRALSDVPFASEDEKMQMKARLLKCAHDYLTLVRESSEQVEQVLQVAMQLSCEEIIHWACLLLQFDVEVKQKILEEASISNRGERILAIMEESVKRQRVLDRVSDLRPADPRLN